MSLELSDIDEARRNLHVAETEFGNFLAREVLNTEMYTQCNKVAELIGQEVALLEAEARARLDILAAVRARTASAIWRNPVNEMFGEHNERVTSISQYLVASLE
ncbi:hypothetical protein LTR09_008415 [Extremus antarcticus]|uniref:Uncharacterized protein n=1 Tax=Extremus antarcticus TaxID=702011 RepID=A0AAJ0DHI0_9PEZI|nr:hypothetical protein LTR09_008415 [Extremus antarcticus]